MQADPEHVFHGPLGKDRWSTVGAHRRQERYRGGISSPSQTSGPCRNSRALRSSTEVRLLRKMPTLSEERRVRRWHTRGSVASGSNTTSVSKRTRLVTAVERKTRQLVGEIASFSRAAVHNSSRRDPLGGLEMETKQRRTLRHSLPDPTDNRARPGPRTDGDEVMEERPVSPSASSSSSPRDCPTFETLLATEEIAAMSQEARQAPVCDAMLRSPHLRRLFSDTLSNTWAVAATRRGSKAGEPLADLAFGMLMRRILERVRERMDEKGIVARLPVCGATPFETGEEVIPEMEAVSDISYVDDASAYTWSPDPQTVIENVKSIVAIYHEEFLRHGMQLNYAAGKSECLVALRGKGAAAVRERVFVRNKAKISVESQTGTLLLRVVDAYKHLGGIVTSSGSQSRELQARVKATNGGVAALNRPVVGRHEIHVEDKILLCSTLADTRLFLYAGTWTSLSAAQQRTLHSARVQILRRATNMQRRSDIDNATDREVLVAAGWQCCDFCSSGDWFDGELHRFSLCYRLEMGMSAHGHRQFDVTWLGSANPKRVATSMTSLTLSTVTAVTGWNLLVKSQLSGKHG